MILSDRLRGTVHDAVRSRALRRIGGKLLLGRASQRLSRWASTAGGPTRATHSTSLRGSVRNRMYWEGPQIDRPNERPYALHRNGYAGMQRYASFLWSGDVYSTWETLKTHIPIAINTGLSGIPYWGTDIGGFVPTPEFTAELYLRWFQFGAFCPLFRSSRPHLEAAAALGMEHRRHWPNGNQQLQRSGDSRFQPVARHTRRTDLPQISGAALPLVAVSLQLCARMREHWHADHARAVAAFSRRSEGRRVWRRIFVGQEHAGGSSGRKRSDDSPSLPATRWLVRLLDWRAPRRRSRNQPPC